MHSGTIPLLDAGTAGPRRQRVGCHPLLLAAALWALGGLLSEAIAALSCAPLGTESFPAGFDQYTESLLWEITGNEDISPSFIFGTLHLDPAVAQQPSARVRAALERSTQFGAELNLESAEMAGLGAKMRLAAGQYLNDLLEPELFSRAVVLLASYGLTLDEVVRLKPWAAYTLLSVPPGAIAPVSLDAVLLARARQAHKPVFALETLAEQLASLDHLPLATEITLLREMVCHYALLQTEISALIRDYAKGDFAAVVRTAGRHESEVEVMLNARLLDDRNERMVARLRVPLSRGGAFVAIGALHLSGRKGVLARLAALGYRVRPLASH